MKRTALYLRASSRDQIKYGFSIPDQLARLRGDARAAGEIIVAELIDQARSGASVRRPAPRASVGRGLCLPRPEVPYRRSEVNGTVAFGVALIVVGLATGGRYFLPLLIGGVVVAAAGAFVSPRQRPSGPRRLPRDDDPSV